VPAEIVIRDVESLEEVRRVEQLQGEVWGMDDRDITSVTHLVAVKKAGGQLIGAFEGGALVGFVYGFVGLEHGQTIHHSHMLGVLPRSTRSRAPTPTSTSASSARRAARTPSTSTAPRPRASSIASVPTGSG
jgi:hypothetical protein